MPKNKTRSKGRDGIYMRGATYYISYVDAKGRRRQEATAAMTLTQARDIRALKRQEAERHRVQGYTPPSKDTFAEFVPRYLKHQKAKLASQAAYERCRGIADGHLKERFGSVRLAEIRRVDVDKYLADRSEKVKDGTIIKEFNVLKHMLRLAEEWELITVNYAHGVRPPKQPPGRLQYLAGPTELRRLLAACPAWLQPIVVLAVASGMRQGEILGLQTRDISSESRVVRLRQTKNGEVRIVPLNNQAIATIMSVVRADASPTQSLFDIEQRNRVSVAFARAARKAKIDDFTFHDLRHTFASWMVMAGASLRYVADVLGHRNLKMVMRYAHLSPEFKEKEVSRIDGQFTGLLADGSGPALLAAGTEDQEQHPKPLERRRGAKVACNDSDTIGLINRYKPALALLGK
jgi:integrase